MGKYLEALSNVYSIFETSAWIAENIKTVPSAFVPKSLGNEFIRIDILFNQGDTLISCNGLILIDIFILAGNGPKRVSEIADKLDSYLVGKSLKVANNKIVQCFASNLNSGKYDADNSSLWKSTYQLNFKYYGV